MHAGSRPSMNSFLKKVAKAPVSTMASTGSWVRRSVLCPDCESGRDTGRETRRRALQCGTCGAGCGRTEATYAQLRSIVGVMNRSESACSRLSSSGRVGGRVGRVWSAGFGLGTGSLAALPVAGTGSPALALGVGSLAALPSLGAGSPALALVGGTLAALPSLGTGTLAWEVGAGMGVGVGVGGWGVVGGGRRGDLWDDALLTRRSMSSSSLAVCDPPRAKMCKCAICGTERRPGGLVYVTVESDRTMPSLASVSPHRAGSRAAHMKGGRSQRVKCVAFSGRSYGKGFCVTAKPHVFHRRPCCRPRQSEASTVSPARVRRDLCAE